MPANEIRSSFSLPPHFTSSVNASLDVPQFPELNADAFSYLGAVNNHVQDRPEVYDMFLDIMKDFTTGQFDIPGLIERVSKLFQGNPPLIQGFNAFLPAGYKISVDTHATGDTYDIIVTTPRGTTTETTVYLNNTVRNAIDEQCGVPGFGPNVALSFPLVGMPSPTSLPPLAIIFPVELRGMRRQMPFRIAVGGPNMPSGSGTPHKQFSSSLIRRQQTNAAASLLTVLRKPQNTNQVETGSQQPLGDFILATKFLNKIWARFSDGNNTYKKFLNILQMIEEKGLQYWQVCQEVQTLFKDAPDLMAEFKSFLPDSAMGGTMSATGELPPAVALATKGREG